MIVLVRLIFDYLLSMSSGAHIISSSEGQNTWALSWQWWRQCRDKMIKNPGEAESSRESFRTLSVLTNYARRWLLSYSTRSRLHPGLPLVNPRRSHWNSSFCVRLPLKAFVRSSLLSTNDKNKKYQFEHYCTKTIAVLMHPRTSILVFLSSDIWHKVQRGMFLCGKAPTATAPVPLLQYVVGSPSTALEVLS